MESDAWLSQLRVLSERFAGRGWMGARDGDGDEFGGMPGMGLGMGDDEGGLFGRGRRRGGGDEYI